MRFLPLIAVSAAKTNVLQMFLGKPSDFMAETDGTVESEVANLDTCSKEEKDCHVYGLANVDGKPEEELTVLDFGYYGELASGLDKIAMISGPNDKDHWKEKKTKKQQPKKHKHKHAKPQQALVKKEHVTSHQAYHDEPVDGTDIGNQVFHNKYGIATKHLEDPLKKLMNRRSLPSYEDIQKQVYAKGDSRAKGNHFY